MNRVLDRPTSFKANLREWASISTFHGLPKIIVADSWLLRIFWLLVTVPAYAYCASFIMRNVADYYEYPVITNINRVYESAPEFPTVKFCYHNRNSWGCSFNKGQSCNGVIAIGYCYIFNRGKDANTYPTEIYTTNNLGMDGGLTLHLLEAYSDPIEIYIYNNLLDGDPNKKITIAKGVETNLAVGRRIETKLDGYYSECKTEYKFDLGAHDHNNKTSYPYFQSDCVYVCIAAKKLEACNKTTEVEENHQYYYTNWNKYVAWLNSAIDECYARNSSIIGNVIAEINRLGENQFCQDRCPIECKSFEYEITPYYRNNPSISYAMVRIYFEDFHYTAVTEQPKITAESFFGNIGGMLGLFLGTSLFSFAELAELPLFMCLAMFKRTNKVKKASLVTGPIVN